MFSGTVRRTLNGTFTAQKTGLVVFGFDNWRKGNMDDPVTNYIDHIRLLPKNPSFEVHPHELSVRREGFSLFTLDAGSGYANQYYLILSGVSGTYPGFTLNGIQVPLNPDGWTWWALELAVHWPGFLGYLDERGRCTVSLVPFKLLPSAFLGATFYFDYLILQDPGSIVMFASNPVYVLFIP